MELANHLSAEQFFVEDSVLCDNRANTYYGTTFKTARHLERMEESGTKYSEYLLSQPQGEAVCVLECRAEEHRVY